MPDNYVHCATQCNYCTLNTCTCMLTITTHQTIFMAHRAISMIAFPRVQCMFIYIYMFVSPTRVCVAYVVKEVTSFPGARSINGRGA